jgi:uncharacterized protein with HEPN domain
MTRDVGDYLEDMLAYAGKTRAFVEGLSFDAFSRDEKTQMAVIRGLEVIGEAARQVPEDVQERFPEIPWREIIGMRNVLVHAYFGVKLRVVFDTATTFVPELIDRLPGIITAVGTPD